MAAAAFGRPVVLAASADTLTKVQSIIAEQLGTDTGAVGAEKKFADLGADSLDTVEIMMALEEQFDISIDEEGELQLPPPPPDRSSPRCPCPLLPCPVLPPPLLAPHSQPPDRRGVKRRGGGSSICGARGGGPSSRQHRPPRPPHPGNRAWAGSDADPLRATRRRRREDYHCAGGGGHDRGHEVRRCDASLWCSAPIPIPKLLLQAPHKFI